MTGLALDVLSQRVPHDLVPDVAALQEERDLLLRRVIAAEQAAAVSAHAAQMLSNRIGAARNYCSTVDPGKADVKQVLDDIQDLLRTPQPH